MPFESKLRNDCLFHSRLPIKQQTHFTPRASTSIQGSALNFDAANQSRKGCPKQSGIKMTSDRTDEESALPVSIPLPLQQVTVRRSAQHSSFRTVTRQLRRCALKEIVARLPSAPRGPSWEMMLK